MSLATTWSPAKTAFAMTAPTNEEIAAAIPPEELERFRVRFDFAANDEARKAILTEMGIRYVDIVVRKCITEPLVEQIVAVSLNGIVRQVASVERLR